MNFLVTFIVLSIINVVLSTIKSICTINGGKLLASLMNGIYFAFYNVMLIFTVADFPLVQKCIITCICNIVGVYIVKYFEEKSRADKLWRVEMTVLGKYTDSLHKELDFLDIPHNYITEVGKYSVFTAYCATQAESAKIKTLVHKYDAKFFVSETKDLF